MTDMTEDVVSASHDPCPECGVCQDDHGDSRRVFHLPKCPLVDEED